VGCKNTMLEIKHFQTERGGEFVIERSGNRAAEMAYTNVGDNKITIDHTFVEKPLRGMGMGKSLVKACVEFARARNIRIHPLCPFAKALIERDFPDVL